MRKEKVKNWIEDHKKEIIIGGICVAAGVGLTIGGYTLWSYAINPCTGKVKMRFGVVSDNLYCIEVRPIRKFGLQSSYIYTEDTFENTYDFANKIIEHITKAREAMK